MHHAKILLWVVFALTLPVIAYMFLDACDVGVRPLFGLRSCQQPAIEPSADLRNEQDRERALRAGIHEAELRLAQLPACPRPEGPVELQIPLSLEDLRGCWQSERGDIQITTDDEQRKPTGKVRICLCFVGNGRGTVRMVYTDGAKCEGPLSAKIGTDTLSMHFPEINCTRHGSIVSANIICRRNNDGAAAMCDTESLGRMRGSLKDEKYRKVDSGYCDFRN